MPRNVSEALAGQIVILRQEGYSYREISDRVNAVYSVVRRTWLRYRDTNTFHRRRGQGRHRVTTGRTDRAIVRSARRDPYVTARQLQNHHRDRTGRNRVSCQTIRNRLHEGELRSRQPTRVPALTPDHRRARLTYARTYGTWTNRQWRNVLFTDESRYCLYGNDRRRRVWRRRGERFTQRFMQENRAFGGGSVMVWGGISINGRTELVLVPPPGLNAQRYVDEILRPHVLPVRRRVGRAFSLMQDNATCHNARLTTAFLQRRNIEVLPHPPRSPDLNPIEHVWDILGRRLRDLPNQPANLADLFQRLREIWNALPQEQIRNCINMQDRLAEVVRNRGGNTHY